MNKIKKILSITFFLLLVCFLRPAAATAPDTSQVNTPSPSVTSNVTGIYSNVDSSVPRNLSTLTQSTFIEVLAGATCILGGQNPIDPERKCLGVDATRGKIGYVPQGGGIAQVMGSMIGGTMVIPISGTDYAKYAFGSFGITKTAYAQQNGIGYNQLSPLLGIWTRFRDIAYLAFVLAFTLIGLAIMFRVKIDARTVMTIQNQIPKIVIALILVTFSYAIAGFLIDIMYVIMYLVIVTFNNITPTNISNPNANIFTVFSSAFNVGEPVNPGLTGKIVYTVNQSGVFDLTFKVSQGMTKVFTSLTTDFINSVVGQTFKGLFDPFKALDMGCNFVRKSLDFVTPGFYEPDQCSFAESFFRNTVYIIFTMLTFIVVLIALLYTLFKVWFLLIKSFAYVLVDAIIAPLWITAGIFPGSKLSFTTWIRHLMGHLSVFPMTFAVILLGKTIMDALTNAKGPLFSPPLIGDPVAGNINIAAFVGFGFIISLPTILDKTKKAVGAMDFGLVDIKAATKFGIGAPLGGVQRAAGVRHASEEIIFKRNEKGLVDQQERGIKGAIFGALRK